MGSSLSVAHPPSQPVQSSASPRRLAVVPLPQAVQPERPPQLPQAEVPLSQKRQRQRSTDLGLPKPVQNSPGEVPSKSREGGLECEVSLGQNLLEGRGSQILYILIEIKTPKMAQVEGCTDLAVVLDVSGSMRGKPAEVAIAACLDIFQQARSADRCWLVAFANQASFLIRAQRWVQLSPSQIKSMLDRCHLGGGTYLGKAFRETLTDLLAQPIRKGGRHILLVTDGQTADRQEVLAGAAEAWQKGISVSCIGTGRFDKELLNEVAERGHGTFYALPEPSALPEVLKRESSRARALLARNLEVQLQFEAQVSLRRAFQVQPTRELTTSLQGGLTVVQAGDLVRGQDRKILLELEATPIASHSRKLAQVHLVAQNPDRSSRPPQTLPDLVAKISSSAQPDPQISQIVDKVYAR
jgi:hypothetical protein